MEKQISMSEAELKALVQDAIKSAEDNARRGTVPEAFQGQSRDEARTNAKHILHYLEAAKAKNVSALEKLYDERPDLYPGINKAAFSEAANATGAFAVPSVWAEQIMANVEEYGWARRIANVYPMPAKDVKFTTGGGVTVAWPGNDTAPTPFDATGFFSQTTLTAATMAAGLIIQRELLEDTNVQLIAYLSKQYGIAVAKEEDTQFFKGTGSPHTGIISTSGVNVVYQGGASNSGKTTRALGSWSDYVDLKLSANTAIQGSGVYVLCQSSFARLLKEVDSDNRPILNQASPLGQPKIGVNDAPWILNGSPCYVVPDALFPTDAVTTACAIFGDFKSFGLLGVRQDMTMETYDQSWAGVDLSGKRQIAIVVTERVGVAFPVPSAFSLLKTSTT